MGTINVLNFCKKKLRKLYFHPHLKFTERRKFFFKRRFFFKPKSIYGLTKVVNEEYIKEYCKKYNLNFNICRFFNIYGVSQNKEFVIPNFVNKIKNNKFIKIYGKGNQVRSFCYVDDATKALIKLIFQNKKNKIYNIGNNKEPIKIINLAKLVYKLSKKKVKIKKNQFFEK